MTLRTVRVPPEIEPLFAKAEKVVAEYFNARRDDPARGTIEIFGDRYVLVRAGALSVEFFSLVRGLFGPGRAAEAEEFARNILFDLAHAVGKTDARNFHAKMGLTDPIERLSAGPVHFSHSGWAFVDISAESHPTPDEAYYLLYDHPYSFEADAWLRAGQQVHFPVCIMNAGYSSGWCEESFGVTLVASEILCRAKGDDCCRFIMVPPGHIERHIERYMRKEPTLAPRMRTHKVPDFLERKRVAEELRQSEAQYRAIFEASVDALLILDQSGTIVDVNPAACAMYGYTRQEMVHLPGRRIVHPGYHHRFEQFKRQAASEEGFHVEAVDVRKDGTAFNSEVRGTPIDYHGSRHLLAVVRDVTERKQAEEVVRDARDAAESANRAKSRFLANMSHEIRTPLTAILGFADLLKDPTLQADQRDSYVDVVVRNGKHLLELINRILDLSTVEAGELAVRIGPCRLAVLVEEVIDMMHVQADQRGIALAGEFVGTVPQAILSDSGRLRQILVNLVGNAIKFTEQGSVRVVVSFLARWREQEPAVRLQVIDTGIGFSQADLPALFQPFVQADGSNARKYGGTGLGLAIASHLADLLGGELTAESVPGSGSTFTLTIPTGTLEDIRAIPRDNDEPHPPREAGAPALRDLTGVRVLLAEDGVDNRLLIGTLLSKAGAEVDVVGDGRAAVEKAVAAGRGGFDVILMDMQMPEMDGSEATRVLRARGYTGAILALTAHAMSGDRQRCLAAGCDAYLTKPVRLTRLIEAVSRHSGRQVPDATADAPCGRGGGSGEAIRSDFADDEDMAEIINEFVAGLPRQVRTMREALANRCFEMLHRQAHRLKGAGGSYGFPAVSEAAGVVTEAAEARDMEAAGLALHGLAALCEAIVAGQRAGASVKRSAR